MGKEGNYQGLIIKQKIILWAMIFIIACMLRGNSVSSESDWEIEVEKKLKLLNKPAVKSIQSEDGDIIDCVEIHKQPAFDHPLLKNHTIHLRPGHNLQETKGKPSSVGVVAQVWQKSGSCPEGTIPIRQVQKSLLLKADSLERFGRRDSHFGYDPNGTKSDLVAMPADQAVGVLITQGYSYSGVKADINVWNPYVESPDEYSNSMVFLRNGPYYDYDEIGAGWGVNPGMYGDKSTRLSAYWMADASVQGGCFDHLCPGFVQVSKDIVLGAAISPISIPVGQQYQITITVAWDQDTECWWLLFRDEIPVGYWHSSIFGYLTRAATTVLWGGEVHSKKLGTPHTATQMGSGKFALGYLNVSCYMYTLRIRDNSLAWKYPEWTSTYSTQYRCYDTFLDKERYIEPVFYFGGPGRNDLCP